MRLRRVRFTVRAMMIAVAITAICTFIIAEAIRYQARHTGHVRAWDGP
ncbi:MAG: hypothetical protein ACHRXM_27090 [Isosphaerales bacterium]